MGARVVAREIAIARAREAQIGLPARHHLNAGAVGVALSHRIERAHEEPPALFGSVVPIEAHPRGRVRDEQVEVTYCVTYRSRKPSPSWSQNVADADQASPVSRSSRVASSKRPFPRLR